MTMTPISEALARALEHYQAGRLEAAEHLYRDILQTAPDEINALHFLGLVYHQQGKSDLAADSIRQALARQPDYAEAHCDLGHTLQQQCEFREALEAYRRGHELGSKNPRWPYPSALWVRQCERWVQLDARLPAILRGEAKPANSKPAEDEIATLKAELSAMQQRLEHLSRRS